MSFLVPLALLAFVAAVLPLLAHALRRGKASAVRFPAARFVPNAEATTQKRSRVEDRFLLALRLLLLASVAMLGATPLLSCSRLALTRQGGASMAVALVVDDSASMRVDQDGRSRLARAVEGAKQLLRSARPGDAFSIILAGKPARVLTPATTDLGVVRSALGDIPASDRPTDLPTALALATSINDALPQNDRRVIVLSDFATSRKLELPEGALTPLPELREPFENCAIARATARETIVDIELRCTSPKALRDRSVVLIGADGKELARAEAQDTVALEGSTLPASGARVELTGASEDSLDRIAEDDHASVLQASSTLTLALRVDRARAGVITGTSTVVQKALASLETAADVQSLGVLPDTASALLPFDALVIDDPPGLTAETRTAIETWTKAGGVALLLLGPTLERTPLGSGFAPFVEGAPLWSPTTSSGAKAETSATLGALVESWEGIEPSARATFPDHTTVSPLASFDDDLPMVIERPLGRGLLLTSALPSSVDVSDFALRPAYLALLDHVVHQAALRQGSAATVPGTGWRITPETVVEGPSGPLDSRRVGDQLIVQPAIAGPYTLRSSTGVTLRHAIVDAEEAVTQPQTLAATNQAEGQKEAQMVDISREIALLVLLLSAIELAWRMIPRERLPWLVSR